MEVITVVDIQDRAATVRLPDTSEETWSVASLPPGVLPGDRVGVLAAGGDLEMVLLPRPAGIRA